MKDKALSPIVEILHEAAVNACGIIRAASLKDNDDVSQKESHQDIVTRADKESQFKIHQVLLDKSAQILGLKSEEIGFIEEESVVDVQNKHTFIVDPLDGTTNFSKRLPGYCVSIAYAIDKNIVAGVVMNPINGEYYFAEKNHGAFFVDSQGNIERLSVVQPQKLKDSLVAGHYNGLEVFADQMSWYQKLYPHIRGLRNIGSMTYDLCYLSSGKFDAVFCGGCYLWDVAASGLIAEEVGLGIFEMSGEKLEYNWQNSKEKYRLMACHPDLVPDFLKIFSD